MSHYAPSPASICDAIINALEVFKKTGHVRTIKRLAGELSDDAALDRLLTRGVPAMLVVYSGGPFKPKGTAGRTFSHERRLSVICCAGSFQDQQCRFQQSDASKAGIEQLLDWATYHTMRTLLEIKGLRNIKVLEHRHLRHETGKYVYEASFSFVCDVDFWEDEPEGKVEKLGLTHFESPLSNDGVAHF